MKQIEWKTSSPRIGPSVEQAFLGRVKIGYARYSINKSKGDPSAYDFGCMLPGITKNQAFGERPTLSEAKEMVERLTTSWFKETE